MKSVAQYSRCQFTTALVTNVVKVTTKISNGDKSVVLAVISQNLSANNVTSILSVSVMYFMNILCILYCPHKTRVKPIPTADTNNN